MRKKKPAQVSFPFAVIFVFHVEVNLISVQLFRLINSMPLLNCYYTFPSCCCLLFFLFKIPRMPLSFFCILRLSFFFSTLFVARGFWRNFLFFLTCARHFYIFTQQVTMDLRSESRKNCGQLRWCWESAEVQCTVKRSTLCCGREFGSLDDFLTFIRIAATHMREL